MVMLQFAMKTSLEHLPAHKQDQIRAIASVIQRSPGVEMIILFGSYARGDWVEDLPNAYFSDYDIMVVVATPQQARDEAHWAAVSNRAGPIGGRVPLSMVVHDIKDLNREIRTGQYFFSDVVNEGVLLFDTRRFQLAKPKAQGPAQRLELARRNFRYWFGSASEFWRGAAYYAGRGLDQHAAFSLHQATERYFHAVLLVFTGYKPKTHDIEALANQTAPFHGALEGALPRTAPEDEHVFSLLKRAYIEARYSKNYHVTDSELVAMRAHVLDLAHRARAACADKLRTIYDRGEVGPLPEPPTPEEPVEVPALPSLDDAGAIETWRDAMVRISYEREAVGRLEGRQEGILEGEAIGRQQERASALVDVLRRRGVELTELDVDRVLACRDAEKLAVWWERAWTASSIDEFWGE